MKVHGKFSQTIPQAKAISDMAVGRVLLAVSSYKIWRKFTEQKPTLFTYCENDADRAAVVGFRFERDIRNCEPILVKILC